MSANLSLGNCVLDDLRATLEEEEEGGEKGEEEEEEEDEGGSTRETSVDALDVPEKQSSEQRIRRYMHNSALQCQCLSVQCGYSVCRVWDIL